MLGKGLLWSELGDHYRICAMDAGNTFRRAVGARIRAARTARELSQSGLARLLLGPVECRDVSRWERGKNLPSWTNLRALAVTLDLTLAWLIDEEDEEPEALATRAA
jgi:transcriptional regulator with XRE-family HTH domain